MRASILAFALLLTSPASALAESWCAYPLWVHEWGVQAFSSSGAPTSPAALPSWFHRSASRRPGVAPVRHMPADSGMRALPVLHFYSAGTLSGGRIPVGVEVGFTRGEARVWYPQVDTRRRASAANTPAARQQRASLLRARGARDPIQNAGGARFPSDPTAQLVWDRLELSAGQPAHTPHRARADWVRQLRDFDSALWVDGAQGESERFVFYEAETRERVPLRVERGPTHRAGRRHLVLRNTGSHAVHDVFFTHREGEGARERVFVFFAPSIPAGARAGFVLEEHAAADVDAPTRDRLRTRLVDAAEPTPPTSYRWGPDRCVMQRDPAVPVDTAEGHRLYAHEVDAILAIWGERFFAQPGTTLVYREDTAYLDQAMPLAVYTDMYNFVLLRRAGLAVWSDLALP